jgi:hypothetical protein
MAKERKPPRNYPARAATAHSRSNRHPRTSPQTQANIDKSETETSNDGSIRPYLNDRESY